VFGSIGDIEVENFDDVVDISLTTVQPTYRFETFFAPLLLSHPTDFVTEIASVDFPALFSSPSSSSLIGSLDLMNPDGSLNISITQNISSSVFVGGHSLVFRPAFPGFFPEDDSHLVSFNMKLFYTPNNTYVADTTVHLVYMNNMQPLPGSSGSALFCDGVDDFAFSSSFSLPLSPRFNPNDNLMYLSSGGITVEFWTFVELDVADRENIPIVFSIGNGEFVRFVL